MLVLTRKQGERIRMQLPNGECIWVMLGKMRGATARIAIDAPDDVLVLREEVIEDEGQGEQ